MWGTIAKMRVKPGMEAFIRGQFEAMATERMHGWLSTSIYRSVTDPQEFWMVAMFESEAAYKANAASRAQHTVYLTLRSAMETDPEWHDVSEYATLHADGH